jgi:hypothetical protein
MGQHGCCKPVDHNLFVIRYYEPGVVVVPELSPGWSGKLSIKSLLTIICTLLSTQRRSFRQRKWHSSRSESKRCKSRQRRPCSPNFRPSARASTAQWLAIWILGRPARSQPENCSWVRAHGIYLALSRRPIHRSSMPPGRELTAQHVNDDYLRETKWKMSKVCAHLQLHRDFRLLDWLENCLIWLATMNRADFHVKFHQDRSRESLYSLIWEFLLSQINIWTTTTWSNVWVVLPKPSW